MEIDCPPPPEPMSFRTSVNFSEIGYERAWLKSLLAQAESSGDRTFSVFREGQLTVRRAPLEVLDQLAGFRDWSALRTDSHVLALRSVGVFAIVGVSGSADRCAVNLQVWADTGERAEAVQQRIFSSLRADEIADVAFSLNWRFLDGKGEVRRASTEERASERLLDEAYPVLGGVEDFIEEYLDAPESVLVLQGAPGTGKTRLIREILGSISRRRGETAAVLYTGDTGVLENEEVFLEFIVDWHRAFVVEDADHLLTPRSAGNQTLHRFLNIADGIASAHGKKIIFSTNLPSARDIDEALVRPGRCFAHIYLQALQADEAVRLLNRLCDGDLKRREAALASLNLVDRQTASVAAVYAADRNAGPVRARAARVGVRQGPARMAFGFN